MTHCRRYYVRRIIDCGWKAINESDMTLMPTQILRTQIRSLRSQQWEFSVIFWTLSGDGYERSSFCCKESRSLLKIDRHWRHFVFCPRLNSSCLMMLGLQRIHIRPVLNLITELPSNTATEYESGNLGHNQERKVVISLSLLWTQHKILDLK